MKKILLIGATLMLAHAAFSQGTVVFNNRIGTTTTSAPGEVIAPIYGVNPTAPTQRISGNTTTGVPAGSTSYGSSPFVAGNGFTATLWAAEASTVQGDATANNLVQVSSTTFRTSTSGSFAGTVLQPANAIVPGVAADTQRGTFQMRVWDNQGGSIGTWAEALAAWTQGRIAIGWSELFTTPYALGGTANPPNPPPNLQGLQSFNLVTVPEPSVIALGVLGAGCLFLLRRRK